MELRLSQCGLRAAQELMARTPGPAGQGRPFGEASWSLALAGGPDPAVETVRLKDSHGMSGPPAGGQGMGAYWGTVQYLPGLLGAEDLTALGVGRSLPAAAARTGRGFQKQSSERLFNSRKKEKR